MGFGSIDVNYAAVCDCLGVDRLKLPALDKNLKRYE